MNLSIPGVNIPAEYSEYLIKDVAASLGWDPNDPTSFESYEQRIVQMDKVEILRRFLNKYGVTGIDEKPDSWWVKVIGEAPSLTQAVKWKDVQSGRGEWTARTLDDARQMAMDFARSVG